MISRYASVAFVFSIILFDFCVGAVKAGQISVINPSAGSAYIETTPIATPDSGRSGSLATLNYADQTLPSKRVENVSKILDETLITLFSRDELDTILFQIEDYLTNNLTESAQLALKKQRARILEALKER